MTKLLALLRYYNNPSQFVLQYLFSNCNTTVTLTFPAFFRRKLGKELLIGKIEIRGTSILQSAILKHYRFSVDSIEAFLFLFAPSKHCRFFRSPYRSTGRILHPKKLFCSINLYSHYTRTFPFYNTFT